MAKGYVLDASALLASLFDEPGVAVTDAALELAVISAVNYSEVVATQVKHGERVDAAIRNLDDLDLPVIAWDAEIAREAADLSSLAWTHGLSFGDRACLATARRLRRPALTADRKWRQLPRLGIEVKCIR